MYKVSKLGTELFLILIKHVEFVVLVLPEENLIVQEDKFGDSKLVHYGVHIVKKFIYQKLMFHIFQKEYHMKMQQLHQ